MKPAMKYTCACLALAVGMATIVATLATAQQPPATLPRPVETTDPIERFAELMPVITHARCMGCHGAVNPFDGVTHGGGVVDAGFDWRTHDMNEQTHNRECLECHTAGVATSRIGAIELRSGKWRLAPRHVAFVGKDTKTLCRQFANDARIRSHLMGDELIGLAFVGRRGDATEHADPPPMTRNELVEAADRWLTKGWAKCGRWNGKITQKEEFRSNYSYSMPVGNGSTTSVQEVASREITIWRKNGVTTASVIASGSSTIINTMRLDGPNGPCTAVATSTGRWHSTASPNGQPDLSITIDDNGGSTIRFATPAETGNSGGSGDIVNDCGIPFPADGGGEPPVQLEWPSWVFMIRCPSDHAICQLFDPEQPRLSGTMERTITDHSDAAEPQSWLTTGPVGISRSDDGTSIPVKVTTTWDLTLEE